MADRRADRDQAAATGPMGDLKVMDHVLTDCRIVVVAGPGGVGKTTMAAAMGLRAARHLGRRVVVVTVDPARRLAGALGMDGFGEDLVLIPVGNPGRLWAVMVDMATSWDRLVEAVAPDAGVAQRLQANDLYQTLTRRFVQSHDYIALDRILELEDDGRYDLVIVDTPPSAHAIDLLDAPGRMLELFDSRLLRWLAPSLGASGTSGVMFGPFQMVARRLLGDRFLDRIVEFFTLFAELRPAFTDRIRRLEQRLAADDTAFTVVSSTDPLVVANCQGLIDGLVDRDRHPKLLLLNRLAPTLALVGESEAPPDGSRLRVSIDESRLAAIDDPSLATAVRRLVERAHMARMPTVDAATVAVPLLAGDLADLDGLDRLLSGASR